jgi:ribonucrease Y
MTGLLYIVFAMVLGVGAGTALGYYLRYLSTIARKGSMENTIKQMELAAQSKSQDVVSLAEDEGKRIIEKAEVEAKQRAVDAKQEHERLIKKEALLDERARSLDTESSELKGKIEKVRSLKEKADGMIAERQEALEKVAQLSTEEAKAEILAVLEKNAGEDLVVRARKLESIGREKLEKQARDIIITAIHRIGNSVVSDVMATTVQLPNEEIKGKIIGKEGRNVRALEKLTGVDFVVDDTPGVITLSCFDPVRRQIARIALENLILDGRIQPAKIEEAVQKAGTEINRIMKEKGEAAAYEAKVPNLDPRLILILGRLYFRTSYGQNVLDHSVEMSHVAAIIAAEVGADVAIARAGALLHDIGKAMDHEVAGTHVEIGRRILQKFGVDERVVLAMQPHHEEYPYETPESYIVQVADAISGGRPGVRRDSVEQYIKRLEELESIATKHEGVEKAYAIAAGREVRVFVRAESIGDLEAHKLARDIAKEIEDEMQYPGEIKINVIRETRAIEYAR